ncbi:hypothetical protein [Micromonospora hortensis]|uniref:hypothetical protein n=1 Tax=Micromonospora hortensis TaxID=2911209 RepID=UPI001EE9580A|nr:hypothetical protein [Micromonospora hortensis]MCG5450505.1 hypothetical protein [Micromonospora hortensis]
MPVTIESKDDAGAALERVGFLQQQVDAGQIDPAAAGPEIVETLNAVVSFFVLIGATGNLYTALVEPLMQWNIYSVSPKFLRGPESPETRSARELFEMISAFYHKWEVLKTE